MSQILEASSCQSVKLYQRDVFEIGGGHSEQKLSLFFKKWKRKKGDWHSLRPYLFMTFLMSTLLQWCTPYSILRERSTRFPLFPTIDSRNQDLLSQTISFINSVLNPFWLHFWHLSHFKSSIPRTSCKHFDVF